MQKAPPSPKGFRDITPTLAAKRRNVIGQIVAVLEKHDFVPIETPTIEFAETLTNKYGDEEKLIYKFVDRGNRKLALRYDFTVPLARYVATNNPVLPFRRYQVGQVFRGENPQKGRYREFTQFDFDTVGSKDLTEDAKIIAASLEAANAVGAYSSVMFINDRKNFKNISTEAVRTIDKLHKIGEEGVKKELISKGISAKDAQQLIRDVKNSTPTDDLKELFKILTNKYKLQQTKDFLFDPTLARGLDYYTGPIFELKPTTDPKDLSLGSGGRYDNLIGSIVHHAKGGAKADIPATGFSFGLDRLVEILA